MATAKELWGRAPSLLKAGSCIDNEIYTSPEVFRVEQRLLFDRCWLFACHESEVSGEGAYREVSVSGKPLVLWRDKSGRLRAFYNACRHRGAKVTRCPAGVTRQLECIYHHWTYSAKGDLLETGAPNPGAPLSGVSRAKGYEDTGFCKEEFPLVEVSCEAFYGFVFVSLDPAALPLEEFLAPLEPYLRPIFSEKYEVFHFHRATLRTNWKLFVDNNREIYHVLLHYLNRKTASYAGAGTGKPDWVIMEHGHGFFGDAAVDVTNYDNAGYDVGNAKTLYPLPGVARGAQPIAEVFPDLMINIRSNVVRVDRLLPISPGVTILEQRGLGLRKDSVDERRSRVSNHNLVWGPFGRNLPEDGLAVELQFEAISAGAAPYSIVAREEALASMDDESLRAFYREWSRWTGIDYTSVTEAVPADRA